MSRPTKLTTELQGVICCALAGGNTRATAAGLAGIGERTLYRWLERGEEDSDDDCETEFRQFWQAVKKAEAEAVEKHVAIVRNAAPRSWQAAAWWLERRYPDDWGRKQAIRADVRAQVQATGVLVVERPCETTEEWTRVCEDQRVNPRIVNLEMIPTLAEVSEG